MKQRHLWIYYLLSWISYTAYLWIDNIANGRGPNPYVWSNLAATFVQFSFCFFLIYPHLLRRSRLPWLPAGLLAAIALWTGMRAWIEEVLYVWLLGHHNYTADTTVTGYIKDNLWRSIQPMLLSFIIWAFLDTFRRERETEQLKQEKIQAELAFLKSQINPHFLYNSLNYIYSLAYPVSAPLANAVIRLSGLMRYLLAGSSQDKVPLQQELDYLEDYIALYQLRFEDRCFVNFQVEGHPGSVQLASLLLIPFVENAFKHGVFNDPAHPVNIQLQASPTQVNLLVSNKINRQQKDPGGGIGMANVRRRLELLYPGRFTLSVQEDETFYATHLHIQLK